MISREHGNSTEVEYRYFMDECWQDFMETFTKCATLPQKTAISPAASKKKWSHFCNQVLRFSSFYVADKTKILLNFKAALIESQNHGMMPPPPSTRWRILDGGS